MKTEPILASLILMCCLACGTQEKYRRMMKAGSGVALTLTEDRELPKAGPDEEIDAPREELHVQDDDGTDLLIMKAEMDENGDMVASDVIQAAKVTARFRNVAERNGKVNLRFDITIPGDIQDSRWQLRFIPVLHALGDSTELETICVTGSQFRKSQLRGYQQYERFLASLAADSSRFVMAHQLETFVMRNLPGIYRFHDDSTFVSDSLFESAFGVTGKEACDHYTKWLLVHRHERRMASREKVFRRHVRTPLAADGLRLDTVVAGEGGDLIYRYVHSMDAPAGLRKAEISLTGEMVSQDGRIAHMPSPGRLTFYISSLSTLMDDRERYLSIVRESRRTDNAICDIRFRQGDTGLDPDFGSNRSEELAIRKRLAALMTDSIYDLDSIVVQASCSPEGSEALNRRLSDGRAASVSAYFREMMQEVRDSVLIADGAVMDLDGNIGTGLREVGFSAASGGEDWESLKEAVFMDEELSDSQKAGFRALMEVEDADRREELLRTEESYPRLKEHHYPALRKVRFRFFLHLKGTVRDTVVTDMPDTVYRKGLDALRERNYQLAESLLRPYGDYNAALAHCAMNHEESALAILENIRTDGRGEYLKAILYSRKGEKEKAARSYRAACEADRSYVNRANLDPELAEFVAGQL